MSTYPGDDEEKTERARQREQERQERQEAERRAAAEGRARRRRERAARLRAARAAWEEANGAEQTRMVLFGAGRLLGHAIRRTWRWLFTKHGGFFLDRGGRTRDTVVLGGIGFLVVGVFFGMAVLTVAVEREAARRDASKCRAVYEQIARAPDEFAYQKARALLAPLTCTHASVPGPERIEELMGKG